MAVTSPFIWYIGTSAYDLRKVSSAVANPDPTLINVRFIDCPQVAITFDKAAFEAAWQTCLTASLP
jgi:ribosomal protein S27E